MAKITNSPRMITLLCSAEEIQAVDTSHHNCLFSRSCDGSAFFIDLCGLDAADVACIAKNLSVSTGDITDAVLMLVEG